jgi:hypothetical protein
MAQTAVEFLEPLLLEKIQSLSLRKRHEIVSLINQAKEIDKEQLKLFFMQGVITKCESFFDSEKLAEQYYNETFNKTQAQ